MPVSAETLRLLLAAGLTGEALVAVVEAIDRDMAPLPSPLPAAAVPAAPQPSAGAERTRRWRARQAASRAVVTDPSPVTSRDVTGDEGVTLPGDGGPAIPETKRKVSPATPSKEKTQPWPDFPLQGVADAPPQSVIEAAANAWNRLAGDLGLPPCARLTETRRRAIAARLRDAGGLAGWQMALDKLRLTPFCLGGNGRGWRADIDWLASERGFTRLLEGALDPGPSQSGPFPAGSAPFGPRQAGLRGNRPAGDLAAAIDRRFGRAPAGGATIIELDHSKGWA